ncbi:MAG TPA: MerR family transcriptional regulator, partial [Solirubrobacterales bacterium]|nr:MerR family transcriptional regulator [Solirubrobacterales bacterium]
MAVATRREEGDKGGVEGRGPDDGAASRPRKALTIGAVAKILSQEFDDISISKIRYLEDQKLLTPRRTQGGYRLYSQADVERLRAILRMQRDEFLPLRVIRQELATGDFTGSRRGSEAAATRRAASVDAPVSTLTREELLDQAGVSETLLRELQEFGIVQPERRD